MRVADPRIGMRSRAGFATATVLGLVAVIGLLSAGTLHDALFGELLASSRQLHQRAGALAEFGIQRGLQLLDASLPIGATEEISLQPLADSTDSVSISVRRRGSSAMPAHNSIGRFVAHHFEIESTGYTTRGTRMTQIQGATRVVPVAPAEAVELVP